MPPNNAQPYAGQNPHQALPFFGDPRGGGGAPPIMPMPPGAPMYPPPAYPEYPVYQGENYDYDYGFMTTEVPVTVDPLANLTKSQELEIIDNIARRVMGGPLRVKPTGANAADYVSYYDSMYQQYFQMLANKRPRTRRRRSQTPKTYPPQILNLTHYLYFNDYSVLLYDPSFFTEHDYDSYYYVRTRTKRPGNSSIPDYLFYYTRIPITTKMTTVKRTRKRRIRKDAFLKALKGMSKKNQIIRYPNNTFAVVKDGKFGPELGENYEIVKIEDIIKLMSQGKTRDSPVIRTRKSKKVQSSTLSPALKQINDLKHFFESTSKYHNVGNETGTKPQPENEIKLNEGKIFKRSINDESIHFHANSSSNEMRKTSNESDIESLSNDKFEVSGGHSFEQSQNHGSIHLHTNEIFHEIAKKYNKNEIESILNDELKINGAYITKQGQNHESIHLHRNESSHEIGKITNKLDIQSPTNDKFKLNGAHSSKQGQNHGSIHLFTNRSLHEIRMTSKFQGYNSDRVNSKHFSISFSMQNKSNVINGRNNIGYKRYHSTIKNKDQSVEHRTHSMHTNNRIDQSFGNGKKRITNHNSGSVHNKRTIPVIKQSNILHAPLNTHRFEYERHVKEYTNNERTIMIGNKGKTENSIALSRMKRKALSPTIFQMKNGLKSKKYSIKRNSHAMTHHRMYGSKKKYYDRRSFHPADRISNRKDRHKRSSHMKPQTKHNVEI